MENFKRLAITDLKVEIPRLAKKSVLKKALEDAGELEAGHCFICLAVHFLACGILDARSR